jgi:translation initiation factor 1 (eIF-1/SUI1)
VLEESLGTGALDRAALLDVLITTTKDSSSQTALCDTLKAKAGTGGTLKDGVIELQGDQVEVALAALAEAGFRPKQAGG